MVNVNNNRNVHIRFEDKIFQKAPCSFGFSMNSLSVFTTNEKWQPEFIDRTEEANKFRPLHKHLNLVDFAFYWESNEKIIISDFKTDLEIENKLAEINSSMLKKNYILRPCNIFII